jgi:TatD DNase family protein
MFIDTHTHLYVEAFDADRIDVIRSAQENGLNKLLLPNIDVESIKSMYDLVENFPSICYPMMGLHPGSVNENWEADLERIKTELFSKKFIAVGEIGMDLYWDDTFLEEQEYVFKTQVKWAKELGLPIAIHARKAFENIFKILDELNDENLTGVFHCFTGTMQDAKKIISYGGFKLGIGGVITYKNAHIAEVVKQLPMDLIVLETDSPYLPPVPHRGKRNESAYLVHVADKIAELKGLTRNEVGAVTTQNALALFKFNDYEK